LGTTLEVPTLAGRDELEVPSGTQSGTVFRMGGKGMPDPRRRGLGDLLVQVIIEVPKKLSKEEDSLLRELAELEHKHVAPERKGFFEKLKEYFTADEENPAAKERD
jgi:molecular chaperone DnaJ